MNPKIPILEGHPARATGQFVEVVPATTTHISTRRFLEEMFPQDRIEHLGHTEDVEVARDYHLDFVLLHSLFFQTVHRCFAAHHPLTLRPEVLMYLIVHEIAVTVNKYPEEFRHRFTRSQEKVKISVRHDELMLGNPSSPWQAAIALFDPKLRAVVPAGIMKHLLPEFSTATPQSKTASLIAFMDATQNYFEFEMQTMCGIPEIRLAGTADDYRKIVNAASQLAEVFSGRLGTYFAHLLPVLAKIAEQADGASLDEEFWRSIYKYESWSGGDDWNGWLSAFVHYEQIGEEFFPRLADQSDWNRSSLTPKRISPHVSSVPFQWDCLEKLMPMQLVGGVLAVDLHEGSLMPGLSYAVLHNSNP